jgi:hypothetical protein
MKCRATGCNNEVKELNTLCQDCLELMGENDYE